MLISVNGIIKLRHQIGKLFFLLSLVDSKLYNHINSAVDIFNCRCDADIILPSIEKILNIKYNLKITERNSLKLEKYY